MPAKKPTVQTRLQKKAAKANKIVTGPKGSKPQSTTNAALLKQGNKTTRGGLGSGRPKGTISQNRPKPAPKPAAKPAAAPAPAAKDGRQPRALTNTKSATMRQIRAKAVQARRINQGKSTVASRQQGITPDSARGQRIRAQANRQRVIGDSGQVRAAQQRGQAEAARAQTRRNARAAMGRMSNKLAQAALSRVGGRLLGGGIKGEIVRQTLTARNTAPGTISSVDPKLARRIEAQQKSGKQFAAQEAKARKANQSRKTSSFDDAFRSARKAGVKSFTWKGKKYTTKMKGE